MNLDKANRKATLTQLQIDLDSEITLAEKTLESVQQWLTQQPNLGSYEHQSVRAAKNRIEELLTHIQRGRTALNRFDERAVFPQQSELQWLRYIIPFARQTLQFVGY